jgi:hypothetical protein
MPSTDQNLTSYTDLTPIGEVTVATGQLTVSSLAEMQGLDRTMQLASGTLIMVSDPTQPQELSVFYILLRESRALPYSPDVVSAPQGGNFVRWATPPSHT